MTDFTGAWTAAFTGNQIVSLLRSGCGLIVAVRSALWEPDLLNSWFFFLSHSICNVSSQSRATFFPLALLPCCAGFSEEMPACCRLSPYPYFIMASSCPSIHLSICDPDGSSLWLGKCVQSSSKSITPLWFPALPGFYLLSGETYCRGRSVGWLEDSYYPAGSFSVF